jgi:hypothetical protein
MSTSRALDNIDLELAQRDITDIPFFEEEATPVLAGEVVAGIDLDPELIDGYDPFF